VRGNGAPDESATSALGKRKQPARGGASGDASDGATDATSMRSQGLREARERQQQTLAARSAAEQARQRQQPSGRWAQNLARTALKEHENQKRNYLQQRVQIEEK
jgi:hypothetical protein